MRTKFMLPLAGAIFAVAGCSGGGEVSLADRSQTQAPGGSPGSQSCGAAIFDPVPVLSCDSLPGAASMTNVDALPGGYWSGRFVDETQDVQGYMMALVAEDGRFQLQAYRYNETNVCHNWEAGLAGTVTTAGNAMHGSGRMIAVVPTLADGTLAADLEIDGVVAERDTLVGHWTATSGDAGCFLLDQYWQFDYEAPSALEYLAGVWTDWYSSSAIRLTVADDGSLDGSDRHGCNWSGRFGLIDDRFSLYEFEAELESCERAGHYTGLAWYGDGWDPGEYWLQIRATDGERALMHNFSSR